MIHSLLRELSKIPRYADQKYYLKNQSNTGMLPGQVLMHTVRQNGYTSFLLNVFQGIS